MSKKRLNEKVRGRYTPVPHDLLDSPQFIGLSHIAKALLFDALRQHNGRNNGHIQLSEQWLKRFRGWVSGDTIQKSRKELIKSGLLALTKQGGMGIGPSLYAFTWMPVTDYLGLDLPVGTFKTGSWRGGDQTTNTPSGGV